jgi:hypothetical protein
VRCCGDTNEITQRERTQWVRPQGSCSCPSHWPIRGCFLWSQPHFGPRRSGNGSQTHGILQHWLFGRQPYSDRSLLANGVTQLLGDGRLFFLVAWGTLRCSPLLCGWKLFFWAALPEHGGACHFGPLPSLPWPLGHVRLISVLRLVCAALLSSLPVSPLIPALRGLSHNHIEKENRFLNYSLWISWLLVDGGPFR